MKMHNIQRITRSDRQKSVFFSRSTLRAMCSTSRGFGLIELLITLAVIGLLVTMINSNLGVVAGRKSDAQIRASLTALRATAKAYYIDQDPFSYRGMCGDLSNDGAPTKFSIALLELASTGGGLVACAATNTEFAAAIDFSKENDPNDVFCVDTTGFAGKITEGGLDIVRIGRCIR